ncbi:MAG: peptide deformylase [Legionellales bacterium]|nr:peptide deformylase [Legionellales bacterium]
MPNLVAILVYPDPRLYKKAELVEDATALDVQAVIDDMFYTLENTPNCAGLAATQLDFANPKAITVLMDYSHDGTQPLCLINPVIIEAEGEQNEEEGCMSVFPRQIHEHVKRAARITVRALDRHGKTIEYKAEGYIAKLIQHEVDHLNGKIYLQRLSLLKRARINQKIKKITDI